MRHAVAIAVALAACKTETPHPDSPSGNHPPPRVIAGGGIGDGAIDGVVNLHVIDDETRLPIPGAAVTVGGVDGITGADGLFVATGVVGAQTVIAKATGYRSELWIGANGANLTVDLVPAVTAAPPSAQLSGQITGFAAIPVAAGHARVATVAYTQTEDAGDAANTLKTAGDRNVCVVTAAGAGCPFTITTRTGTIGLIAAIYDRDLKGTADPDDDVSTLIRWAYRGGIAVAAGADQTGVDLALLDVAKTTAATIDFGAPPLARVTGVVGLDTADGIAQLPALVGEASGTLAVPTLAAIGATGYRLTAVAEDSGGGARQSVVIRRGTSPALAAGAWLMPPTAVTVTRTTARWTPPDGTTVTTLEYTQGAATVTRLLAVTVLDGTTDITLPAAVALPSGAIDAKVSAIAATGLDVRDFGLDADRDKLDRIAAQPRTLAPGAP